MVGQDDVNALAQPVERMVKVSGRPEASEGRIWPDRWLMQSMPALGSLRPFDVLRKSKGLEWVRGVLWRMQSGAYSQVRFVTNLADRTKAIASSTWIN